MTKKNSTISTSSPTFPFPRHDPSANLLPHPPCASLSKGRHHSPAIPRHLLLCGSNSLYARLLCADSPMDLLGMVGTGTAPRRWRQRLRSRRRGTGAAAVEAVTEVEEEEKGSTECGLARMPTSMARHRSRWWGQFRRASSPSNPNYLDVDPVSIPKEIVAVGLLLHRSHRPIRHLLISSHPRSLTFPAPTPAPSPPSIPLTRVVFRCNR